MTICCHGNYVMTVARLQANGPIAQQYVKEDIPTYNLEGTASNHVSWVYIVVWSKALKQCTIQYRVRSATQC